MVPSRTVPGLAARQLIINLATTLGSYLLLAARDPRRYTIPYEMGGIDKPTQPPRRHDVKMGHQEADGHETYPYCKDAQEGILGHRPKFCDKTGAPPARGDAAADESNPEHAY